MKPSRPTYRQVLAVSIFLPAMFLGVLLLPLLAFAQAEVVPVVETRTFLGTVLQGLAILVMTAVLVGIGFGVNYLKTRAKDGLQWSLLSKATLIMKASVARVDADLRPLIVKALEDGKVTSEEAAALKSAAITSFKASMGDSWDELKKSMGLGDSAFTGFVESLLEQAVGLTKATKAAAAVVQPIAPAVQPSTSPNP